MSEGVENETAEQAAIQKLSVLLSNPASLVCAAPGCGKTSAVIRALSPSDSRVIKISLEETEGFTSQIGERLDVNLPNLEALPQVLHELGQDKSIALVIDDADCLLEQIPKQSLRRMLERIQEGTHIVFLCSTFISASALRKARSLMFFIGPDAFKVASPPNASAACWGWAAGIAEVLCELQAEQDISPMSGEAANLVLEDCLEDYVWNRLSEKQRSFFLAYTLDWEETCSIPFEDARLLPALPMTRFEVDRVLFHEAYRLLARKKLQNYSQAELLSLYGLLAKRQLTQGHLAHGARNAMRAHDWKNVTLLDPFELLYSEELDILQDMARTVLENSDELALENMAVAKFVIRLAAARAIQGEGMDARQLLEQVQARNLSELAKRESLIASSFIEPAHPQDALHCLLDALKTRNEPSDFFSIDDLYASGINRLGFSFLGPNRQETNRAAIDEALSGIATLFDTPSLRIYYQGVLCFLHCEFFDAKKQFQHALLESEQIGSICMQRATVEALVELDTVQQNISSAHRQLTSLRKLPSEKLCEQFNYDLLASNLAVYEGDLESISTWIKNGDIEQGRNVANACWGKAFLVNIMYNLKRRRTIKAITRTSYLEQSMPAESPAHKEGYLLLIKACCEHDLGHEKAARQIAQESYKLLSAYGYLLPFIKLISLENRYGELAEKIDPSLVALLEDNERNIARLHDLHSRAQERPAEGLLSLLTNREFEVAKLAADGYQNKEIASRLSITERTVKEHLTRTYKKLQVGDRRSLKEKMLLAGTL